jgi:hypothetical protein
MALIPMISCRGNIRQECLGLSIVGIVKSGNQDAFIQNKDGVTRRYLDLQSLHVVALAKATIMETSRFPV